MFAAFVSYLRQYYDYDAKLDTDPEVDAFLPMLETNHYVEYVDVIVPIVPPDHYVERSDVRAHHLAPLNRALKLSAETNVAVPSLRVKEQERA
ncbi:hypothetical protein GN244_ATG16130 [Phytophthora infestans]|uniref:Uncharacterized protein n=1 Tax=Phytophthora infestans TaxID=4787 RepID=A0A833RS92_PHYIN|nr:hypothetical protein GN244_ATG16130 [Phytophthora infestans]KAF4128147.1 hypothetical protein GN958_ATG22693 [Phytophthora infestans]